MLARKATNSFASNRVGFSMKDGKTYFFDKRQIVVMKGWPAPFAWRRTARIPWHPTRKHASPPLQSLLCHLRPTEPPPLFVEREQGELALEDREKNERYAKAIAREKSMAHAFVADVPAQVLEMLLEFSDRHWNLFSLFARCPGADDLARSNPALCFALASCWVFHKPPPTHPLRGARRLVGRKQKEILRWLGFPATESSRRISAKLHAKYLTVPRLLSLRRALEDPSASKTLAHLPSLNGAVLDIMGAPWHARLVRPSFLHEIVAASADQQSACEDKDPVTVLRDTCHMARQLHERLPNAIESIDHLVAVHDRISARYQTRAEQDWPLPESLPPPPFAGTPNIVPLEKPADVIEEGREMEHCCSSYLGRCAEGYSYLYRVSAPVRATLELRRTFTGWKAAQLCGVQNRAVSRAVKESIIAAVLSSPAIAG